MNTACREEDAMEQRDISSNGESRLDRLLKALESNENMDRTGQPGVAWHRLTPNFVEVVSP